MTDQTPPIEGDEPAAAPAPCVIPGAAIRDLTEDLTGILPPVGAIPIENTLMVIDEIHPPKTSHVQALARDPLPQIQGRAYRIFSDLHDEDIYRVYRSAGPSARHEMPLPIEDDRRKPEWRKRRDASAEAKAALVERMRAKRR